MPPTFGEAKNSWLTGTAAWTFFNVSQYILGIQPTLDGLKVDPCIPHTLGGFTVTRRYRGATYHIAVDNTAAVQYGVKSVAVDGKPIEGSLLPLAPEGAVVEVQARAALDDPLRIRQILQFHVQHQRRLHRIRPAQHIAAADALFFDAR